MRRKAAVLLSSTSTFSTVAPGAASCRARVTARAALTWPPPTEAESTRMRGDALTDQLLRAARPIVLLSGRLVFLYDLRHLLRLGRHGSDRRLLRLRRQHPAQQLHPDERQQQRQDQPAQPRHPPRGD